MGAAPTSIEVLLRPTLGQIDNKLGNNGKYMSQLYVLLFSRVKNLTFMTTFWLRCFND